MLDQHQLDRRNHLCKLLLVVRADEHFIVDEDQQQHLDQ
jgi:hypothetical protein